MERPGAYSWISYRTTIIIILVYISNQNVDSKTTDYAVHGLQLTDRSFGSVTVTWGLSDPTSYNVTCSVEYKEGANSAGCWCEITGTNSSLCTVSEEHSGQLLNITVLPNADPDSGASIFAVAEPRAPERLVVAPHNTTAVSVSWVEPQQGLTVFTYNVCNNGADCRNVSTTPYILIGLVSNTEYNITVQTYSSYTDDNTNDSVGGASNSTVSWTYADAVKAVSVDASARALNVSWTRVARSESLKGYVVRALDDQENCLLVAILYNTTEFDVDHDCASEERHLLNNTWYRIDQKNTVVPCSQYTVGVTSVNEAGSSENTTQSANTLVEEPPRVENVNLTPSNWSILVNWTAVPDVGKCQLNYSVTYNFTKCDYPGSVVSQMVSTKDIRLTLTEDIRPYWNYTVTVSAIAYESVSEIPSAPSVPQETQTEVDAPSSAPPYLNVSYPDPLSQSVQLAWDELPLCNRNGPIDFYSLFYSCLNLAEGAVQEPETWTDTITERQIIVNIKPYRNCTYGVAAVNIYRGANLTGDFKQISEVTPQKAPSAVKNVTGVDAGPTWLTVTWDPPLDPNGVITNYTLTYQPLSFADGKGKPDVPGGTNTIIGSSFNQTGLHEFTTYKITVYASTEGGHGALSEPQMNNTLIGEPQVVNITAITPSKQSIHVSWLRAKRTGPTNYYIKAVAQNGAKYEKLLIGYNNTQGEVENLKPYTNYSVSVVTQVNDQTASTPTSLSMTEEDIPGPVTNVLITSDNRSISLIWNLTAPNGVILNYNIQYQPSTYADGLPLSQPGQLFETNTTDANPSVKLTDNIEPYLNYSIQIYGRTAAGLATESDTFLINTTSGAPQQVTNVTIGVSSKYLNVTWIQPTKRTGSTEYEISAEDVTFSDPIKSITVPGYYKTFAQLDVKPYRDYRVFIKTINVVEGTRWHGEKFETQQRSLEDVPAEGPQKIDIQRESNQNCTAANVEWYPVVTKFRNGIIRNYSLTASGGTLQRTVKADTGIEDNNQPYTTSWTDLTAGKTYTLHIAAATSVGSGAEGTKEFITPFCAPPFPNNENPNEMTKTVTASSGAELLETRIIVQLSKSYFNNDAGGEVTGQYLIVADIDATGNDELGSNGTVLSGANGVADLERKYQVWSEYVNNNGDIIRPYRIKLENVFHQARRVRDVLDRTYTDDTQSFTVGEDDSCAKGLKTSCNGPLNSGRSYKFRAVACTTGGCTITSYSAAIDTKTPSANGGAIAAGVIIPLLVVLVGVAVFYMYRKDLGPFAGKPMRATKRMDAGHDNPGIQLEDVPPKPVLLSEFPIHVSKRHENSDLLFAEEYKLLKDMSPRMTWNAAELPCNRPKNRYNNILPFDHSRVKLLSVDDEDDPGSDYINANFVPGYNSKREFIANQGPLESTKDDFWRLIWEQNVAIIVMVTKCVEKGRRKCEQYWPDDNEPVYYGDIQVQVRSESVLNNYTIRIIDISMGSSQRSVYHFNFVSWPDFGCPETTDALLQFVMTVRSHRRSQTQGPTVIHCSAGVGRTGTFVCVDRLLQHMRDHDNVDVFGTILEMRRYRTNMVQTEDQYIYIHDCLRDALSQGLHKQYPTNNPQPPPEVEAPKHEKDEPPLYENVEISLPQTHVVANGDSTGL